MQTVVVIYGYHTWIIVIRMYIFQLCRGLCLLIVQLRVLQYSIEPPGLSPTAHMYTQPAFPRKLGSSIGLNNISTLQTSFINRQKYVKELANMYIHLHIKGRVLRTLESNL
jgi:hypothetical protein